MKYETIDDMWWGCLCRSLKGARVKTRGMNCREITGYTATLNDVHQNFLLNPRRRLSVKYASAELLWYLSGSDSIEMIRAYAPQYKSFAENGVAHGAYGKRWKYPRIEQTQIGAAIELLEKDPTTRQCVVSMWKPNDLMCAISENKKDIPCTLTWQFVLRKKLHMICTMRSNDVWLGFPYDVYVNTTMQKLIASALGVSPGTYTHQVGSMHVYDKNVVAARETTKFQAVNFRKSSLAYLANFSEQAKSAVQAEESARMRNAYDTHGLCDILADAVNLCASEWCAVSPNQIKSLLMRRAACLS